MVTFIRPSLGEEGEKLGTGNNGSTPQETCLPGAKENDFRGDVVRGEVPNIPKEENEGIENQVLDSKKGQIVKAQ